MKSSSTPATGSTLNNPDSNAKTVGMTGPKLNQNSGQNLNQNSMVSILRDISEFKGPKTANLAPTTTSEAKQHPVWEERVIPVITEIKMPFWRPRQISLEEIEVPVKTSRLDGRGWKNISMTTNTNEDLKLSTHLCSKFFNQISRSAFKLLLNDG